VTALSLPHGQVRKPQRTSLRVRPRSDRVILNYQQARIPVSFSIQIPTELMGIFLDSQLLLMPQRSAPRYCKWLTTAFCSNASFTVQNGGGIHLSSGMLSPFLHLQNYHQTNSTCSARSSIQCSLCPGYHSDCDASNQSTASTQMPY